MNATANSVSQETRHIPANSPFLRAWVDGVELAGEHVFSCHAPHPQQATHWRQLIPNLDKIRKALPNRSQQDAIFLAAMVSFYNAEEGRKLLLKAGSEGFGVMASIMDQRRRAIIGSLFIHYQGW